MKGFISAFASALAAAVILFYLGWFFGRNGTFSWRPEPVSFTGTVPADTVAVGMTETPPDTVFIPKLIPVPGPERIVYLPDTMPGAPVVVPIDSVPEGPDRDAAVDTAVTDWNAKRRYTGTLFDDPRVGSVAYDFTVQFNQAGAISYRFNPVPVSAKKEPLRLRPTFGGEYYANGQFSMGPGLLYGTIGANVRILSLPSSTGKSGFTAGIGVQVVF